MGSDILPVDVAERIALDLIEDPQGKPGATVKEILSLVQESTGVKILCDVTIPDLARIYSELDEVWRQRQTASLAVSESN